MHFDASQWSSPASEAAGEAPLRITLDTRPFAGRSFEAVLHVCTNPNCICSIVQMDCTPPAETPPRPDGPRWWIDLDVVERTVRADAGTPSAARKLAGAIEAGMDAANWEWFFDFFRMTKVRVSEEADPDQLDVEFPAGEIEEGMLIGYAQVFPWAETFAASVGDGRWVAVDSYCLRPGCHCEEAGLELFRVRQGQRWTRAADAGEPAAFVFFNHRTGRVRIHETTPDCPRPKPVIEALRKAYPALASQVQERHAKLRRIALRSLERSGFKAPAGNRAPALPPPVGRNDPCPCGSGKKFKKCCGG